MTPKKYCIVLVFSFEIDSSEMKNCAGKAKINQSRSHHEVIKLSCVSNAFHQKKKQIVQRPKSTMVIRWWREKYFFMVIRMIYFVLGQVLADLTLCLFVAWRLLLEIKTDKRAFWTFLPYQQRKSLWEDWSKHYEISCWLQIGQIMTSHKEKI